MSKENHVPLKRATATAEGDFDPRGVKGEGINPKVQAFRVKLELAGPDKDQAEVLISAFTRRCPIYTTLIEAAPIDVTVDLLKDTVMSNRPVNRLNTIRNPSLR